ncbi:MAG TPA: DNA-processing protein DprA, partial [Sunxiuqinia sp.]|nr:DNA-processing protein DprA [Sunxiuqinia sp.]
MNDSEKLKYQIALSLVPAIGFVHAKRLMAAFGSAEAVLKASKKDLQRVPNIGEFIAQKVVSCNVLDKAEQEVEFIEKHRISYAFYTDKNYPKRLKRCVDAPLVLFWKGNIDFNAEKMVAIVGTRNATNYGREFCDALISEMAAHGGYSVVSGLAYGIDVAAHKASLKQGVPTLGVLGHGLDMIYPTLHKQVAVKMLKDGGLVTDFVSETSVERQNFLRR